MDITNGIAGPYSVRLTGGEAIVQGRHAAIVRRYPISMADAAEADARRLQKLTVNQRREAEKADARLRAAAPELLAAALKVLDVAQPEPMSPLWAALYTLREATNKAEGHK